MRAPASQDLPDEGSPSINTLTSRAGIVTGCLGLESIVPAQSPSFRATPYFVAGALGLARAQLYSSTMYCS